MPKFFALIIASDLSLKRMWIDSVIAAMILKEQPNCKIYRGSNDQEAMLVDDVVVWKDVPNEDYKVVKHE
jgi:hypothetical protein